MLRKQTAADVGRVDNSTPFAAARPVYDSQARAAIPQLEQGAVPFRDREAVHRSLNDDGVGRALVEANATTRCVKRS